MARPEIDLLVFGRIATLGGDRDLGWSEALAISAGRIVGAGPRVDLEPYGSRRTRVWELPPDVVVMPGITDAHLHLVTAAVAATQLDLSGARGRDATLAAVAAFHEARSAAGDRDGWLLGHGWSLEHMGQWPTTADLEVVAAGRPVALWAHDHHARWVSATALRMAGIDAASPQPRGGAIRQDSSGRPTGVLHEDAATLVDRVIPTPSADEIEDALIAYARVLAVLGVTGVHDPGLLVDDSNAPAGPWLSADMAQRGTLPLRVVASIRERQLERAGAWGMRSGRSIGRHRDGWLKLFADGSLGSRSAALLEPYQAGDPGGAPVGGPRGMPLRSAAELTASARRASDAGIAVQIHAIGDAAVRTALDVLAGLPAPADGVQHRIEHAQLIHPSDVPRFGQLRVAASVQPCHLCSDATAEEHAWGERAANSFPLHSLDRSHALIPLGTDAPVEPPDPWRNLASAVARRDASWPPGRGAFHAEQSLPLWRAIRAACLDPAQSIGARDEGRLSVGSRADLLVVPAAAFDADDPSGRTLAQTRPLATLIDGRVAYRAPGFDVPD